MSEQSFYEFICLVLNQCNISCCYYENCHKSELIGSYYNDLTKAHLEMFHRIIPKGHWNKCVSYDHLNIFSSYEFKLFQLCDFIHDEIHINNACVKCGCHRDMDRDGNFVCFCDTCNGYGCDSSRVRCRMRSNAFKEELVAKAWHPSRVEKWLEAGIDIEDC